MAPHELGNRAKGSRPSALLRSAKLGPALAWLMLGLALACAVVTTVVTEAKGAPSLSDYSLTVAALMFAGIGALTAARRPRNSLAWVFSGLGLSVALHIASRRYAEYGLSLSPQEPIGEAVAAWLSTWTFLVAVALLLVYLPFLFPDGGLPSRRWRRSFAVGSALLLVGTLSAALLPGRLPDEDLPYDNPVGIETLEKVLEAGVAVGLAGLIGLIPLAIISLALRYRRADRAQRQQIKWLLYPLSVLAAVVMVDDVVLNGLAGIEDPWVSGIGDAAVLGVPIGAGIAVLRYRLLDIDVVIQRSLVFATLTAAVAVAYAVVVSLMGLVLTEERALGLFVATAIVAVLFAPLRERVDRGVSRLFYGERRDPYSVVSRLGRQMESAAGHSAVLPGLVETLAQTLKLSHAVIEVDRDGDDAHPVRAAVGIAQGEMIEVPLRYRGEEIGRLRLAARGPGDRFSAADREVIDDLTRLAALTAHSVRLGDDLQRSRQELVLTREEERARLRRDLHDGLGPTLAGVAFQLAGIGANTDPRSIDERANKIRAEIRMAITEVRRLVDGLRPPALDELGLAGAIERHASLFWSQSSAGSGSPGLDVTVEVTGDLESLPPAVEVAAYRIVSEALTNVVRHASATSCAVRICADSELHIEVTDNGRGIPPMAASGVGLHSMRERAAELGGGFVIESGSDGGTTVRARLPRGDR